MTGVVLNQDVSMQAPPYGYPTEVTTTNVVDDAPREAVRTMSKRAANSLRDKIVLDHLFLVRSIAVRVHKGLPVHVELDDLVHAGILGLIDAASKYDPEKNVVFRGYAKHRIKGAILDSLRQADWASRDMRRRHKQVEAVARELTMKLDREPTEAEIAEKMGVELERWRQMAVELRIVGLVSATSDSKDPDSPGMPDFPAKTESQPDKLCAREEDRKSVV